MNDEPKAFSCTVDADLFRRALSCVSTEETRYYLTGVQVEPDPNGGALLISTDGHRMICIRDQHGIVTGSGIVVADKATVAALKGKGYVGRTLTISHPDQGPRLTLHEGDLLVHVQAAHPLIDGTFPDWRRVVPKGAVKAESPDIDAAYLVDVAKALTRSDDRKARPTVSLYAEPKAKATGAFDYGAGPIAVFGSLPDAFGIVMPTLGPSGGGVIPSWAQESHVHVAA